MYTYGWVDLVFGEGRREKNGKGRGKDGEWNIEIDENDVDGDLGGKNVDFGRYVRVGSRKDERVKGGRLKGGKSYVDMEQGGESYVELSKKVEKGLSKCWKRVM